MIKQIKKISGLAGIKPTFSAWLMGKILSGIDGVRLDDLKVKRAGSNWTARGSEGFIELDSVLYKITVEPMDKKL